MKTNLIFFFPCSSYNLNKKNIDYDSETDLLFLIAEGSVEAGFA